MAQQPDGRVTIHDIARLAGVSSGTVSRVINGRQGAADETRQRVLGIVEAQGYKVNSLAQQLSCGRSNSIGVVFPINASEVVIHPIYPGLLGSLVDAADARGYTVVLLTAADEKQDRIIDILDRQRVDGVILPAAGAHDGVLEAVHRANAKVVVIGHRTDSSAIPWVDCDHDRAAFELTRHVIEQGRRRLVLLNGPEDVSACALRAAGFERAVAGAGSVVKSIREVSGPFDSEAGRRAAADVFDEAIPDAILAGSDYIALGVLAEARHRGIKVPEDLAVTGFDDVEAASHSEPLLTSVRMPLHELGAAAADLLCDAIEGEEGGGEVLLPTTIVYRTSTEGSGSARSHLTSDSPNCPTEHV